MRMRLVACALCAALLSTPAFAAGTEGGSGFLSDYSQLQPVPGTPGLMRYTVPDARTRLAGAGKIYLAPIEIWLSPASKYKGIDPDEMKKLTDEMRSVIVGEFQGRLKFVDADDPDAVALRIALTNVEVEKDPLRLRNFTPIGLVAKSVKAAAGISPYHLHAAAIEAEGYAPDRKERLFASVDRRTSTPAKAGDMRWDQLMDEIRERAKRMRGTLESAGR